MHNIPRTEDKLWQRSKRRIVQADIRIKVCFEPFDLPLMGRFTSSQKYYFTPSVITLGAVTFLPHIICKKSDCSYDLYRNLL